MLFLASRSPRRHALLALLGVPFEGLELEVPERQAPGEAAEDYVRRAAREKAGAGLLALGGVRGAIVLGADTEVVLDGRVLGKPASRDEARRMLEALSGRSHEALSALTVASAGREASRLSRSVVRFAPLTPRALEAYLDSGEWQGKAGAYAIQGRAGAFVAHLDGSHSGVMGLPLHETALLLSEFGLWP